VRPHHHFALFAALALLSGAAGAAGAAAAPARAGARAPAQASVVTRATGLEAEIARLAKAGSGSAGLVGVAAWRLDGTGPQALIHADEAFPMASTFKVAVAGRVLERVDKGELKLDQMISIDQDRMVESEVIADRFIHPGVALSVYNLLELMLTQSDNTATDYMVEAAGGPAAVTDWVRRQGVEGMRIDGDTDGILRRFFKLGAGPFPKVLEAAVKADPHLGELGSGPNPEFDADPRDTTSPAQMSQLLTRIFKGQALSPDSTRVIIGIMQRCRTGVNRLHGLMPPGTEVADKTGTIGGTVNDVGVITLPDGSGQVVVSVYIKASDAPMEAREKTIAQIGRAVRDYYLFQARP
jgi:beta-lactamase class A